MRATFKMSDIKKLLEQKQRQVEQAFFMALKRVGEEFVSNARQMGAYKDDTGNLRSSIHYLIIKNGQVLYDTSPSGSGEGAKKAARMIARLTGRLSAKHPNAFILIGVAGMEYAAAVESKGFDVITGAGQIAAESLRKALQRISLKIS